MANATERRKLIVNAAAGPLNLAVLGGGSTVAASLVFAGVGGAGAALAALGLSVAAYGAMVVSDLFSPRFIEKTLGPRPATRAAPAEIRPADVRAPDVRRLFEAVLAAEARVREQLGDGGSLLGEGLELVAQGAQLVTEAGAVAHRSNALVEYLESHSTEAIQSAIDELVDKARRTRDQKAAATFREAAKGRGGQLEARQQIEGLVDRIRAQLSVITASLDEIHARLVKVKAADADEAQAVGRSVAAQLAALKGDVSALEVAIQETMQEVAA